MSCNGVNRQPVPSSNTMPSCFNAPVLHMQIGRALLSSEVAQAARQGRLLELWHAFGDCLWALAPGRAVPNAGFDAAASRVIAVEVCGQMQPVLEVRSCNLGVHSRRR